MPVVCELRTQSAPPHLQQIFTGFSALARQGAVRCSERFVRGDPALDWTLTVVVNGHTVVYDVHDSHLIDRELLEGADFYFKRGYKADYLAGLGALGRRVHPLGLNYEVYSDKLDLARARRNWVLRRGLRRISGVLAALGLSPRFVPRKSAIEATQDSTEGEQVLFLTRPWDPDDRPDRDRASVKDRESVTDMRAQCILALRRTFGARALVGFAPTRFAVRRHPSLVVSDPRITQQKHYLAAVRRAAVCVTTTGLHGSTGWKLGEYVALGRAIVSEPLAHEVPGPFAPGANYLSFDSPEACVTSVDALLSDPALRRAMATRNRAYYEAFVRPDRLVLNTLRLVLGGVEEDGREDFASPAIAPNPT